MKENDLPPFNPSRSQPENNPLADALIDNIEADNALNEAEDRVGELYRKFRDGEISPEDYAEQREMAENDLQAYQLSRDASSERINNGGEVPSPQPPVRALARGVLWLLNRRR